MGIHALLAGGGTFWCDYHPSWWNVCWSGVCICLVHAIIIAEFIYITPQLHQKKKKKHSFLEKLSSTVFISPLQRRCLSYGGSCMFCDFLFPCGFLTLSRLWLTFTFFRSSALLVFVHGWLFTITNLAL